MSTCEILACSACRNQTQGARLTLAEVPQVDHRISQRLQRIMQLAEALETKQQAAELILPAKKTRSMVLKRSLNMAASKIGFRPGLVVVQPLGLALILGTIPRLKIAFRLIWQSWECPNICV